MRISEGRSRERILLTAQEGENMAQKEVSGMCFLTHAEEAYRLSTSH